MSLLERIYYFHGQVASRKFPNSTTVANHFELSVNTAKRDITYLRERLLAPLVYNQQKRGYFYSDDNFQLPFQESPKIIYLLAILNKLAKEVGLGELIEVKQLERRLSNLVIGDYEKIISAMHCEWIEVETIDTEIFETIMQAVVKNRIIHLEYRTLGGTTSSRKVAPLKIINYQGRWYLSGLCKLRNANRLFHISRVSAAKISSETIPLEIQLDADSAMNLSFGIFQGPPHYTAEILFSSTAAELIEQQHWHKDQSLKRTPDGVILQLPVSDDREIVMKILQYGSSAKVISPPELISRVKREITQMSKLY